MGRLNDHLEQHDFAYLTTTGRLSGEPHRIEIWFAIMDGCAWVNSGGGRRSGWVKNLMAEPTLELEIGDRRWSATATLLGPSAQHRARARLAQRYQGWRPGQALRGWAATSLLIRIEADHVH